MQHTGMANISAHIYPSIFLHWEQLFAAKIVLYPNRILENLILNWKVNWTRILWTIMQSVSGKGRELYVLMSSMPKKQYWFCGLFLIKLYNTCMGNISYWMSLWWLPMQNMDLGVFRFHDWKLVLLSMGHELSAGWKCFHWQPFILIRAPSPS